MTLVEALKTAEELLEKVSVAGEDNWNRMSDSKKLIRAVRQDIERQEREAAEQAAAAQKELEQRKKEAAADGSGHDAKPERNSEGDTGTV